MYTHRSSGPSDRYGIFKKAKGLLLLAVAAFFAFGATPPQASADPLVLKLAFFSSDNAHLYKSGIQPFVDAVNRAGAGRVEIQPILGGALGKDPTKQSKLLLEGTADLAYVIQPLERSSFPDSAIIELPGVYRNGSEATLAFASLVAAGRMRGFDDFYVIGAYASEPETFHTRPPIVSLADLKGKRIRANNDTEIEVFKMLGITPVSVPLYEISDAIFSGKIDGTVLPPLPLIEFGVGRAATSHYLLATSSVPQSLLMSRKKFESLPADVQTIIGKYSGDWAVQNYIRINRDASELVLKQLELNSSRKVTVPTHDDMKKASAIFKTVVDAYVAHSSRNAALFDFTTTVLANARAGD